MSNDDSFSSALGELALSLAAIACVYAMRGYLISTLWGWLVAPVLMLPSIGAVQAAGLVCAVHGFVPLNSRKEKRAPWRIVAENAIYCALLLGIGKVICLLGAP